MPGICGLISVERSLDLSATLGAMLLPLQRQAWYRTETCVDDPTGTAMGRVTLGFVNQAKQPVAVSGGDYVAVMDGELFEVDSLARELRTLGCAVTTDSHAELLLHGFRQFGGEFLRRVHGSFAAAVWHARDRRLTLISDRFGTRPLYYAVLPQRILFASAIASLMADASLSRRPNPAGIAQFFTFGQYLRDDTSLADVCLLPSASCVTLDAESGQCELTRYWTSTSANCTGTSDDGDWLANLDEAFYRAVQRKVADTPNLGLSLSGGLDARSILAVIEPERTPLKTVCLGMRGSLDLRAAQRMADLAGCAHHNHELGGGFLGDFRRHLDDMIELTDGQYLSQCIVMPTLSVYRKLGIEVLLRGHAGELMHMRKAYNYSLDEEGLAIRTDTELESWSFRRLQAHMLDGVDKPLFLGSLQRELASLASSALQRDLDELAEVDSPVQRIWHLFVRQRLRRETVLSLVKFRSVVEPRLPYLDNELVELLLAAPVNLKLGETIQASILAKRRPSFLKVVNANTGAAVGANRFVQRCASLKLRVLSKLGVPGYQPYERLGLWLRRELAPTVKEILLSPACLDNGVYAADGVRHVVTQHLENRRNHTFLLMALMIYELGRRRQVESGRGSLVEETSVVRTGHD